MTDEQIREWAGQLAMKVTGVAPRDFRPIEDAARALIASVRAEAIEECMKIVALLGNPACVDALRSLKSAAMSQQEQGDSRGADEYEIARELLQKELKIGSMEAATRIVQFVLRRK